MEIDKNRGISETEKELLSDFSKKRRKAQAPIARMRDFKYTDEEKEEISSNMYKNIWKTSFEKLRCNLKINQIDFVKLIKSHKYTRFWQWLHKLDEKLYKRAALLIKN